MTERVYLDWNATAPLRPEARAAMLAALDMCGNASSVHAEGRAARRLIEEARERVAALVDAKPRNVVFTSGGTEANMMALSPLTGGRPNDRLLVSAIEHPSVLAGGRFAPQAVATIAVDRHGRIDLNALREHVGDLRATGSRALVSLMLANNETGVIQPVAEAATLVHEAGFLLHVDAVQAAGRIPIDIKALGADLVTISAHKIGGPKGVGALIRREEDLHIEPLIRGGGQERGARAGTENVAAIAGFGAAAAAAAENLPQERAVMADLRARLEAGLKVVSPAAVIFGVTVERLPNTTLFAVPGMKAETAVIAFDLEGVAVSSGAACSSGKVADSHVLAAMGIESHLARGAVRVSLGPGTTESDLKWFQNSWIKLSETLIKEPKSIAA
jgi:cysteine desulfurase